MFGQRAQAGQGVRELVVDRDDDAGARRWRCRHARTARTARRQAAVERRPRAWRCAAGIAAAPAAQVARQPRVRRLVHAAADQAERALPLKRTSAREIDIPVQLQLSEGCAAAGRSVARCARLAGIPIVASRVPRYDYDDQDDDLRRRSTTALLALARSGWSPGALAAAALGLGFLIPYMLYLNHQVSERFGALRWQMPTRVYARPLELRTGLAMDAQTLKTELDAASYRDDGDWQACRAPTRAMAGASPFPAAASIDVDGRVAPRRLQVIAVRWPRGRGARRGTQAEPASPRGWIRRASPPSTARSRKSAGWCGWRKCPSCWSPACRRWRTAISTATTASTSAASLRAVWVTVKLRRREQAGCQHPDPAAGAQRPARHRQGTVTVTPQVQRNPVRPDPGGALRQAHHPRGVLEPGLHGPARQPGDPRRRRRPPSSGSAANSTR